VHDVALVDVVEVRVDGGVRGVNLGEGQRRAIDAARRSAGDDVRASIARHPAEDVVVRTVTASYPIELEDGSAHPHGEAHATVKYHGEPDLFLGRALAEDAGDTQTEPRARMRPSTQLWPRTAAW
jgi:hypothetical protein